MKKKIFLLGALLISLFTLKVNALTVPDQTTPNMIQRISGIFERKPLISKEI